jgi:hypothetical protein
MKKKNQVVRLLVFILLGLLPITSSAQGVIKAESGSRIVSETGTYWVVDGSFTLTNPSATYPAQLANLNIVASASLTIPPLNYLTVSGTLTNSAGNSGLVIKSTIDGTGSLISSTANVPGTMERYIAAATWGSWNDGWHFVSSPVADYPITSNFTVDPATDYDFYAWSEPYNSWVNFKDGTSPTFTQTNGSTTFELGYAYMAAYKTTSTKNFTGSLNVADVSVSGLTLTGSSQTNRSYHLLGNPFTSALIWYTDWTKSNIAGTAQIWDEAGSSYHAVAAGDLIPATNGFMVQVSGGTGSLTIPAAKRIHGSTAFYKNPVFPIIRLKANNLDIPSFQESQVRFNPQSTIGFDLEFDGDFLPGYAPLFYSIIEDVPSSVNSMPELTAQTVVPFNFIKNEGTNFSIEAESIENLPMTLYLFDKKTNITHNLSSNPVYQFTSSAGDATDRFLIQFGVVGIDETNANKVLKAYISNNTLYIINESNKAQLQIFDMQGRLLESTNLMGLGLISHAVQLKAGVYVVCLLDDRSVKSVKIVKSE